MYFLFIFNVPIHSISLFIAASDWLDTLIELSLMTSCQIFPLGDFTRSDLMSAKVLSHTVPYLSLGNSHILVMGLVLTSLPPLF